MSFLAFQDGSGSPSERARDLGFFDNDWPGSFTLPFGEWFVQLIRWAQFNTVTSTLGDIVEWPFSTLFSAILSPRVDRNSIVDIPWLWVVVVAFIVGSFTRNTKVGLSAAAMLATCGFLGAGSISGDFWFQTSRTIGMVLVSVLLCAIIGIPLGIASGRMDGVWTVVRPTLDAMQVVHSFVYMLPFIFFFGIGEVSATMVTMIFAIPPIVRLTNLGIRQVPEDVVEAARSYGASEARVLTDVQLPLARPAILTGLNQTLLLAFSMLGIAAIMGAGGLGKLLFRAINNQDLRLAAGGGLAFFLLAVVFDRITQTEDDDGIGFFTKLSQAWAYRSDPEGLLEARSSARAEATAPEPEEEPAERFEPVGARERQSLLLIALGSVVALVGVVLPWANDAGLASAWGRSADVSLPGQSFNGFEASGGSYFGIFAAVFAVLALLAAVRPMLSIKQSVGKAMLRVQSIGLVAMVAVIALIFLLNLADVDFGFFTGLGLWIFAVVVVALLVEMFADGTPRLGADGALIAAIAALAASLGYLVLGEPPGVTEYSDGFGVYLTIIGSLVAVLGGLLALGRAPYSSRVPLSLSVSWGKVAGAALALLLVVGGALLNGNTDTKTEFGWFFDLRDEFSSDLAAEGLTDGDDVDAADGATEEDQVADLLGGFDGEVDDEGLFDAVPDSDFQRIVFNGVESDGPGLGWISMGIAIVGLLIAVPAAGAMGGGEQMQWKASTALSGVGLALMIVPFSFIMSIVRVADPGALSGVGAFLTLIAGFILFVSGRGVVDKFRRRKIYADHSAAAMDDALRDDLENAASDLAMSEA